MSHSGWNDNIDILTAQRQGRHQPGDPGVSDHGDSCWQGAISAKPTRQSLRSWQCDRSCPQIFGDANPRKKVLQQPKARSGVQIIALVKDTKCYQLREDPVPIDSVIHSSQWTGGKFDPNDSFQRTDVAADFGGQ
jgi:hypothetical protein